MARRLGLQFDDGRLGSLAEALARRIQATRLPAAAYLARLETADELPEERRALAAELTVPESYFLRHAEQLRAFAEVALPARLRAQEERRTLRLLSAGCATGEEAYTLALLLTEQVPDRARWDLSVLGLDVNPVALEKARLGRYSSWSLRETPAATQPRWFRQEGRDLAVVEAARQLVSFEEANLAGEEPRLFRPGSFDVIFCRNVLMYLTLGAARALVGRLAAALAPEGFLFLGHAETLRGLSSEFRLCHTHGAFYYQRPGDGGALLSGEPPPPAPAHLPPLEADGSWVETIRRSAERIEELAAPQPARALPAPPSSSAAGELRGSLELLRQERFAEALSTVRALPVASARDPDVLLLTAALLTHGGELRQAEEACAQLLAVDGLNAGAHYLLALCKEAASERAAAAEHQAVAIYLDPGFAMPRLHLGLLARRSGDLASARRELSRAMLLLQQEEPSRLLLFGGGFSREALVSLCKAELVAAGGALP